VQHAAEIVIRGAGPVGCTLARANLETALYSPSIADINSFGQWEAEGGRDAYVRANALWKKTLAKYEAPAIDPGIDEALKAFIAERKAAMPDAFS